MQVNSPIEDDEKRPSILIIDDEPQIRNVLSATLKSNNYDVLEAATGREGLESAGKYTPDLILLDLGLPDASGYDILKHLREWYGRPIIIVSARDNEDDIIQALNLGAHDYLVKPYRNRELVARIGAAIRRSRAEKNVALTTFGNLSVDFLSRSVKKADLPVKLTSTEYSLLVLFIRNENKVLTHQFVLDHVWGRDKHSESQNLRVFVANLRKKIEDDPNRPNHILTESGVGYRFVGTPSI